MKFKNIVCVLGLLGQVFSVSLVRASLDIEQRVEVAALVAVFSESMGKYVRSCDGLSSERVCGRGASLKNSLDRYFLRNQIPLETYDVKILDGIIFKILKLENCGSSLISGAVTPVSVDPILAELAAELAVAQLKSISESEPDTRVLSFDKEKKECRGWVIAHRVFCGEAEYQAAQALLGVTRFIDEATFTREIEKAIDALVLRIQQAPKFENYIWIVPGFYDRKSQDWLGQRYYEVVKARLGVEHQAQLNSMTFSEWSAEKTKDGSVILVMVDDGVYSGTQMATFYSRLVKGAKEGKIIRVLDYVAYSTRFGIGRFESYKEATPPLEVIAVNEMPMVLDVESGHLGVLHGMGLTNGHGNLGIQFLAHKIPDYLAAPKSFFEDGIVRCKDGKYVTFGDAGLKDPWLTGKGLEFSCIPHISPPYKPQYEAPQRMDEKCSLLPEAKTDYCKRWLSGKADLLKILLGPL